MKNIVTIGGSNSKSSINKVLAEYVGSLVNNVELTNVDLNNFEMPLFSVDLEAQIERPQGVKELNEIIEKADGFVISLAEHNGAYSTAFKNAFDWLSRIDGKVWKDKPMLLLATSPGARGGQTVLEVATGRFPYMGAQIIGSLSVPSFFENFKEGKIVNTDLKSAIEKMVSDFEKAL
jgi:chromate reductase